MYWNLMCTSIQYVIFVKLMDRHKKCYTKFPFEFNGVFSFASARYLFLIVFCWLPLIVCLIDYVWLCFWLMCYCSCICLINIEWLFFMIVCDWVFDCLWWLCLKVNVDYWLLLMGMSPHDVLQRLDCDVVRVRNDERISWMSSKDMVWVRSEHIRDSSMVYEWSQGK